MVTRVPRFTIQIIRLRHNSKIKNYYELMSHLLCLNSCDNYPNKCPHICLHRLNETILNHPSTDRFAGSSRLSPELCGFIAA